VTASKPYFSLSRKTKNQVEICNVKTIAEIIVEKMGLKGIEFKFAGEVDGGRRLERRCKKHAY